MLLQGIRHGNGIHNGGQHTHGIGMAALQLAGTVLDAPPEVAAANDQAHLDTHLHALLDGGANRVNLVKIQTETVTGSSLFTQRLTADLQQDALVLDLRHEDSHSFSNSNHILSYFNVSRRN